MALAMHFLGFLVSPNNIMNCTVQTFKFCDCLGKVNYELKSQTPPYLPNGDNVKKFFYIIGFTTLENGGVGHLQISKNNRNGVKMLIKHKNLKCHISCKPDIFPQK
jgi:hypothetical protein